MVARTQRTLSPQVTPPAGPAPVLVTGFDPFGGTALNPSWLAAQALHGRSVEGHQIVAAQLPTVFDASLTTLQALVEQYQPTIVICLGLAAGRSAISIERVAINVIDARIADNAGAQPIDEPVIRGAPAAYFSNLPIKSMRTAVLERQIAAEVSQTAGTFVCNQVFYGLMHLLALDPALASVRGGFIHVPSLPDQGTPSMPLDEVTEGLLTAIHAALTTNTDLRVGGGAVS